MALTPPVVGPPRPFRAIDTGDVGSRVPSLPQLFGGAGQLTGVGFNPGIQPRHGFQCPEHKIMGCGFLDGLSRRCAL